MDFNRFFTTVSFLYKRHGPFSYTLDEIKGVFRYFFDSYETVTGEPHPPIKWQQILSIMERMPYADRQSFIHDDIIDIPSDMYPEIIDQYFATPFKNCNYRINHFFSGDIRTIRIYELGYC